MLNFVLHSINLLDAQNDLMNPGKNLSTTTLLSAIMTMSFAGLAGGAAFASIGSDNATMNNNTTTTSNATASSSTGNNTTTAAASNKMMGVIASIQQDGNGNPAWITAGDWWLESDAPLIGGSNATGSTTTAEPHISNFTANLAMVSNENGTMFHTHKISNFNQTSVQHQGANSTTVNGTLTVSLREGPVNDVRGYIHITNDKIEFWVDPGATDNHFGPTAITGIVLQPEKTRQMGVGSTTTTLP